MTAPGVRTPGGNPASAETTTADSAIVADPGAQRKRIARIQAELALRGYECHHTDEGVLIVRRWGLSRFFSGADAIEQVEKFGQQVGVKP